MEKAQKVPVDIRKPFGLTHLTKPVYLDGYENPTEHTPRKLDEYVWQRELLNDVVNFMKSDEIALQLIGHAGTGKSSFVEQFHTHLNRPLYVHSCNPRTEAAQLICSIFPTLDGKLKPVYGPLALAAMQGEGILLDEWNLIDPGEASGLNALLEGRSIFCEITEEWIRPQKGFKIFCTQNPKTLGYVGRQSQDIANDDRFTYSFVDYLPKDDEVGLIKTVLKKAGLQDDTIASQYATKFREVAEEVRKQFIGSSDEADALDITLSTRSLVRWAKYLISFKGVSGKGFSAVHYALERAKTFKASESSRLAVHNMVHQVFGEEYKTPMSLASIA
jgi:cobaltochelatase CobS